MAAVEALCHRGVHLEGGQVVSIGPIGEVVVDYRNHVLKAAGSAVRDFRDTLHLRRLEMFDAEGRPSSVVPIGQDLRLRLTFETDRVIEQPRIFLGICDLLGQRLITLQPPLNGNPVGSFDGLAAFECVVHDFPLAPGSYFFTLVFMEGRQVLEQLADCGIVTVVNASFWRGPGILSWRLHWRSTWTQLDNSLAPTTYARNGRHQA